MNASNFKSEPIPNVNPHSVNPNLPKSHWIACEKVVIRDQSQLSSKSTSFSLGYASNKPTAAVIPTTSSVIASQPAKSPVTKPISSPPRSPPPLASKTTRITTPATVENSVQTDDVGIDMDLIFNVEDMVRTQKSLTNSKVWLEKITSDGQSMEDELVKLREALDVQTKVNADLKRLLVSALAGNISLADELIGLTTHNANLSDQSQDLATQKHALIEAAETAEIAADVWRAKCLASRVVAYEAASRAALAVRQEQRTRFALAHLLGERAQIRRDLGQTAALLCHLHASQSKRDQSDNPIASTTLGLATLCLHLASLCSSTRPDCLQPVLCHADTPGEQLAQQILLNTISLNSKSSSNCQSSDSESPNSILSTLPNPPMTDSNDLVQTVLHRFQSAKLMVPQDVKICPGCKGDILIV